MSLLEQNTTKKEWVDKNVTEFEFGNSKEYKVEAIWNSNFSIYQFCFANG